MELSQLQHMIKWMEEQITHLNDSITEATQTNNYGRKIQYEGMRDAFIQSLNKLNSTKRRKKNTL